MYPEIQALPPSGVLIPEIPLPPPAPVPHHRPGRSHECKVCLGEHDPETHEATLSVHGWFRIEVTKNLW
jgi:hypothetical protein